MRFPPTLATASSVALLATLTGIPAAVADLDRPEVVLSEPAMSVAVANTGLVVAALHDARQVAVVSVDGAVDLLEVECSPNNVAIAPEGDTAWATCSSDGQVRVIDLGSRTIEVFDSAVAQISELIYAPTTKFLVVGGMQGQVHVFRADYDYQRLRAITITDSVLEMTVGPDGRTAFIASSLGVVQRVDLRTEKKKTFRLDPAQFSASSLAVSPLGSTVYVAGGDPQSGSEDPVEGIIAMDSLTGKQLWRTTLSMTIPGFAVLDIQAGHRMVYVGSSLFARVGFTSGLFGLQIDADGRIADSEDFGHDSQPIAALARSADGRTLAASTTVGQVLGIPVEDVPYPGQIAISGSVKGSRVTLAGTSRNIAQGTKVTVYVKSLDTAKARFVAQKAKATVAAGGRFTWQGTVKAQRVEVYVQAGTVKSSTIRLTRR